MNRPVLIRRKAAVEPEPVEEELPVAETEEEVESEPAPKKVVAKVTAPVINKKVVAKKVEPEPEPEPDEEPEPAPVAKKKVVVPAAKVTKKAEPESEPEPEEEAEAPAPVIKKKVVVPAAPAAKTGKRTAVEAAEEGEPDVAPVQLPKVADVVMENALTALLDALNDGQTVMLTRVDDSHWTIGPANQKAAMAAAGKLVGKAYWAEVCTPEFLAFDEEWTALTYNEKIARAKKAKVTWEHADAQQVDVIHMTLAMRESLGIKKYKPEYESRKSRDTIRG